MPALFHRIRLFPATLALGLFALLAAWSASPAAAAPSCDGQPATIVSDAAKIVGTKAPDVIVAGPGNNVIYGEGGNDTICAGAGDDSVYGGRGDDTIFGEAGADSLHGERGSDHLDGGEEADQLFGESGNDTLEGGAGNGDRVSGGPGDDTLGGGPGDGDVLLGGPGNDAIDGGPGEHDIASYAGTAGSLTIDLGAGTVTGAEGEQLSGIEDAIGGSGDDTLVGSASSPNRLDGGPGEDHLQAAGSGDEAFGGPGGDSCSGGFAAETSCGAEHGGSLTAVEVYESIDGSRSLVIAGGPGSDAVAVNYSDGAYAIVALPGSAGVTLSDPSSSSCRQSISAGAVSCEGPITQIQASMGPGNDTVQIGESVPASVSSTLEGGPGEDHLSGGLGDDVLYAGADHDPDTLEGGGGDDVLYGVNVFHPRKDSGAATMLGGPGDDLMIGGQPCDGDSFDGGPGEDDSASFARVRNSGVYVEATIGGPVLDPDVSGCDAGQIDPSTEKIEGSPGPDILTGDDGPNVLLGRGGDDRLDGAGGSDSCIGGTGTDQAANCEQVDSVP